VLRSFKIKTIDIAITGRPTSMNALVKNSIIIILMFSLVGCASFLADTDKLTSLIKVPLPSGKEISPDRARFSKTPGQTVVAAQSSLMKNANSIYSTVIDASQIQVEKVDDSSLIRKYFPDISQPSAITRVKLKRYLQLKATLYYYDGSEVNLHIIDRPEILIANIPNVGSEVLVMGEMECSREGVIPTAFDIREYDRGSGRYPYTMNGGIGNWGYVNWRELNLTDKSNSTIPLPIKFRKHMLLLIADWLKN
jgi:hypothetical protein